LEYAASTATVGGRASRSKDPGPRLASSRARRPVLAARVYRDAGHDRCGANLIGNRIRWEMSVGEYVGYRVSNDFLPMLARQMVIEQPAYATFFTFHDEATKKALEAAAGADSDVSG
jgi:hypothetical protein